MKVLGEVGTQALVDAIKNMQSGGLVLYGIQEGSELHIDSSSLKGIGNEVVGKLLFKIGSKGEQISVPVYITGTGDYRQIVVIYGFNNIWFGTYDAADGELSDYIVLNRYDDKSSVFTTIPLIDESTALKVYETISNAGTNTPIFLMDIPVAETDPYQLIPINYRINYQVIDSFISGLVDAESVTISYIDKGTYFCWEIDKLGAIVEHKEIPLDQSDAYEELTADDVKAMFG